MPAGARLKRGALKLEVYGLLADKPQSVIRTRKVKRLTIFIRSNDRIGLKETKWARKTTELSAYFVTFTYSLKRYSINELSSSSILGMIYE